MKPLGLVGKFCGLALFAYLILTGSGAAQEKPIRLNLAYSSISGSQAIVRVIKDGGIFLALEAGSVQATVVGPPTNIAARKAGFTELSTPKQLDLIYPNTCVVTTASAIARNEELVRRVG
ncbi:MAG: hypothetical protein HY694_10655 [Deltaproteobacteria bacterium]|nr:hypothetical protein [Deltaproteobacteria bacterium]